MSSTHSPQVIRLLREAGWTPGRSIDISRWDAEGRRPFPSARRILAEFGGLHIGESGPGVDFARSDVDLRWRPSDPDFAGYLLEEAEIGQRLYRFAFASDRNVLLLVDESGRIYATRDSFDYVAPDFNSALEVLLLGRNPERGTLPSKY